MRINKIHGFFYLQYDISDEEVMIIGNKCDLSDSRVISKKSGESLADEYGARFMETSAKKNINIEKVSNMSLKAD